MFRLRFVEIVCERDLGGFTKPWAALNVHVFWVRRQSLLDFSSDMGDRNVICSWEWQECCSGPTCAFQLSPRLTSLFQQNWPWTWTYNVRLSSDRSLRTTVESDLAHACTLLGVLIPHILYGFSCSSWEMGLVISDFGGLRLCPDFVSCRLSQWFTSSLEPCIFLGQVIQLLNITLWFRRFHLSSSCL